MSKLWGVLLISLFLIGVALPAAGQDAGLVIVDDWPKPGGEKNVPEGWDLKEFKGSVEPGDISVESEDGGKLVTNYRKHLRKLFRPALRTFTTDEDDVETRTELLVLAVLGLNISARSGANRAELRRLSNGIKRQVATW